MWFSKIQTRVSISTTKSMKATNHTRARQRNHIINSAYRNEFYRKCDCFCLAKYAEFLPLFEVLHEVSFEVFKFDFLEHLSHQKAQKTNVILL